MSAIELQHLFEEALSRLARGSFNDFIGSASRFSSMFGLDLDPSTFFYKSALLERSVASNPLTRIEFSNHVLGRVLIFRDELALETYRLKAEALKAAYQVMLHVVERIEKLFHSSILRIISFWILRDIRVGEAYLRAETSEELSMLGSILAKCLLVKIPLERVSSLIDDAYTVYGCGQALKYASALRKMDYVRLMEVCRARFKTNYLKLNSEVSPRIGRDETTFEEEAKLGYELHRLWYMWLEEKPGRLPAPFFIIPRTYWSSGTLPRRGTIEVRPLKFPPFARKGRTVLNVVFGVLGSGKTIFLNSMAVYRLDRGGFGLRLEIDHHRRLQAQLMATPLHRGHPAYDYVVNVEKLRPRAVDVISLVVVRNDNDLKYAKPPLKIDRIVYVENPGAFHLGDLWERLYKPGRLICLKFVNMRVTGQAYTSLLKSFLEFRAERRMQPMFVQIEEALMGAAAKVSMMYSRSMLMSAEEVEILIQGLRGLGLAGELSSLPPDEKVLVIDDGVPKLVEIGSLDDGREHEILVPAFDPEDLKVKVFRATGFIKHKPTDDIYEVVLETGRRVKVTGSHSLFTVDEEGNVVPVAVEHLKPGDLVAIPRKIPQLGDDLEHINIVEELISRVSDVDLKYYILKSRDYVEYIIRKYVYYGRNRLSRALGELGYNVRSAQLRQMGAIPLAVVKKLSKEDYSTHILKKYNVMIGVKSGRGGPRKLCKAVIDVNEDFAWLLGIIASDGCITIDDKQGRWTLEISQHMNEYERIEKIIHILKEKLGVTPMIYPYYREEKALRIQVTCKPLIWLLTEVVGMPYNVAGADRIPLSFLMRLSDVKVEAFLRGYWEGDGNHVPLKSSKGCGIRKAIIIGTSNKDVADVLLYLFTRIGIRARVQEVRASHKSFSKRSKIVYYVWVDGFDFNEKKQNKFVPSKPFLNLISKNFIRTKLPWHYYRSNNTRMKAETARKVLHEAKEKGLISMKDYLKLLKLIEGDLEFVRVRQINKVKTESIEVYDFEVRPNGKDVENFIGGFGGIILHNSQRPAYIISSARGQASNIFTGHMAPQDVEAVFECFPEKGEFEIAKRLVEDGSISFNDNYKWFLWINKSKGEVNFVRAAVPPCGAEITDVDPAELFNEYGLLADGWDSVPKLVEEPLPEYEEFLPEKELERRKAKAARAEKEEFVITV